MKIIDRMTFAVYLLVDRMADALLAVFGEGMK